MCKRVSSPVPRSVLGRAGCSPTQRVPGEGAKVQAPPHDGAQTWVQHPLGCRGSRLFGVARRAHGCRSRPWRQAGCRGECTQASEIRKQNHVFLGWPPGKGPSQEHGFPWTLSLGENRPRACCDLLGPHG